MSAKVPYVSKRRDEPRTVYTIESLFGKAKKKAPVPGQFNYAGHGPSFPETYESARQHNRNELTKLFLEESLGIVDTINDIYTVASGYLWVIYRDPYAQISPVQDVLFPCFHKSLLSLYTSHDLTMTGLWGAARPHLRHAFESLMIAKYCSVNPSADVFDRWIDGVEIYFGNAILKKIATPEPSEFRQLWSLLSDWSHSTVRAGQPSLELKGTNNESGLNFGITEVLLQYIYHLLVSHMVTPSVRYYGNRYRDNERVELAKARIQANFKHQRRFLGSRSLQLIRDYRATWTTL
ncbi:MAG: hypothetical protein HGA87_02965 [Desulfobulbaceae bacterium]|nr:hypothetical protein [Desulfobulbaceae bacterium]